MRICKECKNTPVCEDMGYNEYGNKVCKVYSKTHTRWCMQCKKDIENIGKGVKLPM